MLEILVILAVMGLLLTLVFPFAVRTITRLELEGMTNQTVSLIQQTRMRAIRDNREYQVAIDGNTLTGVSGITAVNTDVGGTVTESSEAARLDLTEHNLEIFDQPSCYATTTDGKSYAAGAMNFDTRGTIDQARAFCFKDPRGNILQVAVEAPSVNLRVRKFLPAVNKFSPNEWEWEWY
jgi:Tfp pilus assembly protein FimT